MGVGIVSNHQLTLELGRVRECKGGENRELL